MTGSLFRLAILLSVLAITACTENAEQEQSRTVKRVVSLSPALTELVCHLDRASLLAGRSDACNYPASVKSLPVAGNFANPAAETVLRLKPDLLLTNALINPKQKKLFEQSGIRVLLKKCDSLADYREWVALLGRELNAEQEAAQELARLDKWERENGKKKDSSLRALLLLWDDPVMAAGGGTLPDAAMQLAGLKNILASETGYVKCSPEFLLRAKPDILIRAMEKTYSLSPSVIKDMNVPKITGDSFDYDLILRPGPRFTDGVDALRGEAER